ncbi:MAG: glycosyltransferase family 4 protein [Chloroflexi bacterium]|nr:glycosyltransferase family 4 protein [Chloroflexota bacterium]
MRIAFATLYDSRDIRRGSGTFYYLAQTLEQQGHRLHRIGPVDFDYPPLSRMLRALHTRISRRYVTFLDPWVGRRTGAQVGAQLPAGIDLLLTNDYAVAAYTPARCPVVLYTDAMLTHDYQERHLPAARLGNLTPISRALSVKTIRDGLQRADLCVFPAQWIAQEARHYGADPAKIAVVPFGANMTDPGPVRRAFPPEVLRLLFVGKDWDRKGGDTAVRAALDLHERGCPVRLHVVGAQPALDEGAAAVVTLHGLLDKADPEQHAQLDSLFRESHALVLPTSSEGFVIAVLEAAAYSLPVLATDVPGVSDGAGVFLPLGAPPAAYADVLAGWLGEPDVYRRLAAEARVYFENSVNWESAVRRLMGLIEERLA